MNRVYNREVISLNAIMSTSILVFIMIQNKLEKLLLGEFIEL